MPKPTTKLAAAVAVCVLGSITLATAQEKPQSEASETGAAPAAAAADECLSGPKGTAPDGSHWYYRTDRALKRKCWYLADEVAKASKTVSSKPAPSAEKPAPRADKPMKPSVANARAELATKTSEEEQAKLAETTWPPMTETTTADTSREAAPNTADTDGQPRQFTSRWPDPAAAANADDLQTKLASSQAANAQTGATQQSAAPAVAPAPQPATAKQSSEPSHFLGLLLSVIAGALALLAILGPMLLRYVRPRQPDLRDTSERRRAIWDSVDQGEQSIFTPTAEPTLRDTFSRRLRNLDEPSRENDPSREIEELLSRASKRSAA